MIKLTDDAQYEKEHRRLLELELEALEVDRKIDEAVNKQNDAAARAKAARDDMKDAVEARLRGEKTPPPSDADRDTLRKEYTALTRERRILAEAIRIQQEVVTRAAVEASRKMLPQAQPQYRKLFNRYFEALKALEEAHWALDRFIGDAVAGGFYLVHEHFPMWPLPSHGPATRQGSLLRTWLEEAAKAGLISKDDVPEVIDPYAEAERRARERRAKEPAEKAGPRRVLFHSEKYGTGTAEEIAARIDTAHRREQAAKQARRMLHGGR